MEIIRQDWKHLVLVEIKGLSDPSTSEGYARLRDLIASTMINEEVESLQTEENLIKRKRVDNEEELRNKYKSSR